MTQNTPPDLHSAIFYRNAEDVKACLAAGDVKIDCDFFQVTPLIFATHLGDKEIVKLLLDAGANPDYEDSFGSTALRWAAHDGNEEILKMLIDANADVNLADKKDKMTALHYAAYRNDHEITKILLAAGADPLAENAEGETPVDYARRRDSKETFQVLIDHVHREKTLQEQHRDAVRGKKHALLNRRHQALRRYRNRHRRPPRR